MDRKSGNEPLHELMEDLTVSELVMLNEEDELSNFVEEENDL